MSVSGEKPITTTVDKIVNVIAFTTALFSILYVSNIFLRIGWIIELRVYLATMLMVSLVLVFCLFRARRDSTKSGIPWYDYLFILASIVSIGYMAVNYDTVFDHLGTGYVSPLESVLFIIAVIVILEGTRRTVGLPVVIIAILFLAQVFFSNYLPGILHSRGYSVSSVAWNLYMSDDGIFGAPLKVVCTIVFAFLVFGQVLSKAGASETFVQLPMAILGHVRGGPVKVAVLGSAFMAMLSGSAIANVSSTGLITIPLMKKSGYDKDFAGAVEAVASSGGSLTPPIMGGSVFLMAEWLDLPYVYLCFCALLPAIFYYLNVFLIVDLEAARTGMKGMSRDSLPLTLEVIKKGWVHFLPIILLIYLLAALNLRPEMAAIYSMIAVIVISFWGKHNRMGPRELFECLHVSFRQLLMVIMAVASAGIIVGCLSVTGLGVTMGSSFLELAGGNIAILMVLAAIAAFIMGMGMHPVVIYIILAVTLAPPLVVSGVPVVAAHFFVMICAMMALITPPVAMAVFAAVAISDGTIMKTGLHAMRLGAVLYFLAFWCVYRPAVVLQGTTIDIVIAIAAGLVSIIGFSAGSMGYAFKPMNWLERSLLIIGAILLIPPGIWNNIFGFAIIASVIARQLIFNRNKSVIDSASLTL